MPDGKRNSLTAEDETDGVNSFYDEDIQKLTTSSQAGKRLPLNVSTRGLNNLSDRLLRAMVANEIKKTLDGEDNKKLVAYHRPVLHSDNELTNGETDGGVGSTNNMVVVGVVLSPKQVQNEDVSKALDILRRNGVTCVCFSLKDSPSPNGTKKDGGTTSPDENSTSISLDELCSDTPNAEKKVSSPTVSTTSDYTSPAPPSPPPQDASCTSTTFSELGEEVSVQEDSLKKVGARKHGQLEVDAFTTPPTLSPSPPVLTPQAITASCADPLRGEQDKEYESSADAEQEVPQDTQKTVAESTALRRKKRRRRLYPYLSKRKAKSKRKKVAQKPEELQVEEDVSINDVNIVPAATPIDIDQLDLKPTLTPPTEEKEPVAVPIITITTSEEKVDPYEFNDSDMDISDPLPLDAFKTPIGRSIGSSKSTLPEKESIPNQKNGKVTKKKAAKKGGSPRKRLTFSKNRAFSPDITDNVNSRPRRGVPSSVAQPRMDTIEESSNTDESSSTDPCVQPISEDINIIDTTSKPIPDNDEISLVLPPKYESQPTTLLLPSMPHCDANLRGNTSKSKVPKRDTDETSKETPPRPTAQQPSDVQIKVEKIEKDAVDNEKAEVQALPLPSDSLPDTPDSMQLRRSSFYSSISRNVRTNLEKYLDGRPEDLKAPKRSKKFKNGFLLHHGDNFPDDPEAPYRLHLATQVLLKLNKRRVKCKPKEEKGKSLLSYLKLQPKRVSRVGKHSSKQEDSEISASAEQTSSVFTGEWTVIRKYICNICGQVEDDFWDMVMHKGEVHPGVVVTHVELPNNPPEGFRGPPSPRQTTTLPAPASCSKCGTLFNGDSELHRHIFECAGNASILEDTTKVVTTSAVKKRKGKRKRGFKRKINGLSKKATNNSLSNNTNSDDATPASASTPTKSGEITKRRYSEVFKCEFCDREFKTEGWLKNHTLSHSLPISIPLEKLSLPTRASISSSRRFTVQSTSSKVNKQIRRET